MTTWKSVLAVAALLAATSLGGTAFAGADDYAFEPVNAQIKSSNVATVAVRVVHKPSGKPVPAAAIVSRAAGLLPRAFETPVFSVPLWTVVLPV